MQGYLNTRQRRGNIGEQQDIFGGSENKAATWLAFWLLEKPAVILASVLTTGHIREVRESRDLEEHEYDVPLSAIT